jgi:hypothetical protein
MDPEVNASAFQAPARPITSPHNTPTFTSPTAPPEPYCQSLAHGLQLPAPSSPSGGIQPQTDPVRHNLSANPGGGENLQQQGMPQPTIDNVHLPHATPQRL